MKKPQGYDEVKSYGEYETLPAGGHKCIIKFITLEKANNGKEYLKINLDIAEGKYKDFFENKYINDTRKDKKWSCVWGVFVEDYNSNKTNPKLKGLISAVEESNNFKFDWDLERNETTLMDKKVGIVFREEEFMTTDGKIKTAVKPLYAVNYDKAEEAKIPDPKKLERSSNSTWEFGDSNSDDLPF